ncbi:MAG: stage III sporulation protein AA [Oscillospiraceae bacterium]|nr:stage III sporulation protein AA [Oscillospiraceae bacterium]
MSYGTGNYDLAVKLLPEYLRCEVQLDMRLSAKAEEIRLRAGRKASVLVGESEVVTGSRCIDSADIERVAEIATEASVYSARESMKAGYITAKGGYRIGICGSAVVKNGEIEGFRELSSAAIRIPNEVIGAAGSVMRELTKNGRFESALIVSPPGAGKTTLLRDMVRVLSDGDDKLGLRGMRVALADERGEIACIYNGVPQRDIGARTDVLEGCSKAQAVMMLLRSMNPQLVALDEITAPEDICAIKSCANCGVKILATAHAEDMNDLASRPMYAELLESGFFKNAVFITKRNGRRIYTVEKTGR